MTRSGTITRLISSSRPSICRRRRCPLSAPSLIQGRVGRSYRLFRYVVRREKGREKRLFSSFLPFFPSSFLPFFSFSFYSLSLSFSFSFFSSSFFSFSFALSSSSSALPLPSLSSSVSSLSLTSSLGSQCLLSRLRLELSLA